MEKTMTVCLLSLSAQAQKTWDFLDLSESIPLIEAFGFTEKTGIDLPGEADSLYVKESDMGIVELSSSAFGQTTKVTPIQMVTAAAAVVNGGKLVTPYVVDKIIDSDGNVVKSAQTVVRRQVISEETSGSFPFLPKKIKKIAYFVWILKK